MPFTQCSFNLVLKFRLCITADCQERREGGKSGKLVNDICAFKFALAQSAPSVSVQEEAADGKRQRKRCSAVDPGNVRSLGSAVVNALIYRCLVTTWAQPQSRGHSQHLPHAMARGLKRSTSSTGSWSAGGIWVSC